MVENDFWGKFGLSAQVFRNYKFRQFTGCDNALGVKEILDEMYSQSHGTTFDETL